MLPSLKFWSNPSGQGPEINISAHPSQGFLRQVVREYNLQSIALYSLNVLLGKELHCISKACHNEGLAHSIKDFSHLMDLEPLKASGTHPELWERGWRSPSTAEHMYQSRGLSNTRQTPGPAKEKIGIHLRTNPKACYFSQSTKLSSGWNVSYLLKFLLWFHV